MIGLMDCNNFFASCERLFRPDLLKKPVAVLSSNDGCIVARSQEVKDMGVPMGVPYFKIKDFCNEKRITLFSSNFSLYRDISVRVMQTLQSECESCELYSIDEAFFEVSDTVTIEEIARIRQRIIQKTGIPVSIGVASTKTLAKTANKLAKQGCGSFILLNGESPIHLRDIPCGSVWGMGRQITARLARENVHTIQEFLGLKRAYVREILGVVGERMHLELSGVPVYTLGTNEKELQASYMSTRSFGTTTQSKSVLLSALTFHVEQLAKKLRKEHCVTANVTILAGASRYGNFSHRRGTLSRVLDIPTNDSFLLTKIVGELLDELFDAEIPYKKAGVVLSAISPESIMQGSLFDADPTEGNRQSINTILDKINSKTNNHALVRFASSLGEKIWKDNSRLRSPSYTTQWGEIPLVKAN